MAFGGRESCRGLFISGFGVARPMSSRPTPALFFIRYDNIGPMFAWSLVSSKWPRAYDPGPKTIKRAPLWRI